MGRPIEFEVTEILDRALALFWLQGYEATSVRDLTSKLGISNSTLYNAFGDKHALYLQVLAHYRVRELAEVESALQGSQPVLVTLRQFFVPLDLSGSGDGQRRGSFALSAAVELGLTDEAVAEQLRDHFDDLTRMLTSFLLKGMQAGEIAFSLDAGDLARYLLHNMYSIGTLSTFFPQHFQTDRMSAVVLSLLDPGRKPSSN